MRYSRFYNVHPILLACSVVLHLSIDFRPFFKPTYTGLVAHARSNVAQSRPPLGPENQLRTPSHPPGFPATGSSEAVGSS